jgi:glycosyltransferase involved in cell wall biosynthesis
MSSLKLFFIVPCYNEAGFLNDTLLSLVAQTHSNWKAVIFDNSDILEEALKIESLVRAMQDTRISYHKNAENIGMVRNFNQGIDFAVQSQESYAGITILASDDQLAPLYSERMVEAIQKYPQASAIFCKTEIIGGDGKPTFSFADWYKTTLLPRGPSFVLEGEDAIEKLIPGNFIFSPTLCLIPKKLGEKRFSTEQRMVFDFDMTLRIFLSGGQMVGLYAEPLYLYRRHENNATNTFTRSLLRFREERDLYLKLAQELDHRGLKKLAKSARKMRVIRLNLLFNLVKCLFTGDLTGAKAFLKFSLQSFAKESDPR